MKNEYAYSMNTFEDLLKAKQDLKLEILDQEDEINNNKWLKLSSSFIKNRTYKTPFSDIGASFNIKDILASPIGNLLNAYLMGNKKTRKYFIMFSIAKEMIPFAIEKIKEIIYFKKH